MAAREIASKNGQYHWESEKKIIITFSLFSFS
jgi:hypothetical protein